jgi:hypothetical protein
MIVRLACINTAYYRASKYNLTCLCFRNGGCVEFGCLDVRVPGGVASVRGSGSDFEITLSHHTSRRCLSRAKPKPTDVFPKWIFIFRNT